MTEKSDLGVESTAIGERLLKGIQSRISQANTISVQEFVSQFGGLSDPNLTMEAREALSEAYRERFGLYEGVDIVDENGDVVHHRPALVTRIKPLDEAGVADPDALHKILLNERDDPEIARLKSEALGALTKSAVEADTESKVMSSKAQDTAEEPSEGFMNGFED